MNTLRAAMIAAGLMFASSVSQQARADVVVIVSAQSAVPTLTVQQIARIFQGNSNSMTPIDIEKPSQARREFYAKVVGGNEARIKERWSRLVFTGKGAAPRELHSGAEVVKAVAADPNLIGYVDSSFVNMTVKVVYTVK